jgi:hypothetical protein
MMSLLEGLRLLQQGEWARAHKIAQEDASREGSWLHGIVHMAEPDENNARYWYRMANRPFPGLAGLDAEMAEFEQAVTGVR